MSISLIEARLVVPIAVFRRTVIETWSALAAFPDSDSCLATSAVPQRAVPTTKRRRPLSKIPSIRKNRTGATIANSTMAWPRDRLRLRVGAAFPSMFGQRWYRCAPPCVNRIGNISGLNERSGTGLRLDRRYLQFLDAFASSNEKAILCDRWSV